MDRVLLYNRLGSYFAEDPGGLPGFLLEENKYGLFFVAVGYCASGRFSFFFSSENGCFFSFSSLFFRVEDMETWAGGYKWHMDKQVIDLHNRPTH